MKFPTCGDKPIGVYPVVDRADKLEPLYQVGITTAQLRVKDLTGNHLEREIMQAVQLSRSYETRLFINDYWEMAIKYQAYGVHLGQEDIDEADLDSIREAGLRLGISSHTPDELQRAMDIMPSYIAIGAIYKTKSKIMPYEIVGKEALKKWATGVPYPVVAIGGINIRNIATIASLGIADGAAMIQGVLDGNKISKNKTIALIQAFDGR